VKDKLLNDESILSCWGSKLFSVREFAHKTLSLGSNCPVTHFHDAHSLSGQPRSFDCGTDPLIDLHQSCGLIRLSTAPKHYRINGNNHNNNFIKEMRGTKGELFAMTSMY